MLNVQLSINITILSEFFWSLIIYLIVPNVKFKLKYIKKEQISLY